MADNRVKLFYANDESVSMTKSEYLELAKQKGWDVKIPGWYLEDYGYIFDCDIFGGDDVILKFPFSISGTLYLGNNAILSNLSAYNGIILGDDANTYQLVSDGDIVLGDYADTCDIYGRNVICGDYMIANNCDISATDGFVIFGKCPLWLRGDVPPEDRAQVSATEDIIYDDEP